MLSSIKKLLFISRPVSWPNTAYPFGAAYLVSGGLIDPVFWVGALYFLIPYNLLMYGVNDVFDYESDVQNPRKGGIEGAKEQKAFHPVIMWSAGLSNVPFVIWLLSNGSFAANIALVVILFFVVAYSIKGLRFKEIPVLDSVTSSIHFVGPMVYALILTGFSLTYMPFIIAFFLWGVASHAFGAIQDIIPDRKGGLKSIATIFGARITIWLVAVFYVAASVITVGQGWPVAIVGIASLAYLVNIAPYLLVTDKTSGATNKGWRRFIWLNLFVGFVITMVLLAEYLG